MRYNIDLITREVKKGLVVLLVSYVYNVVIPRIPRQVTDRPVLRRPGDTAMRKINRKLVGGVRAGAGTVSLWSAFVR